jgi:hypothetical protein
VNGAGADPRRTAVRGRSVGYLGFALAGISACGGPPSVALDAGPQAYYRTGYPLHNASPALERVLASVIRIHVTVAYENYLFPADVAPTVADLADAGVGRRAAERVSVIRSREATAVVVGSRSGRVTLLTARHAVHHPDTVYEYFGGAERAARQADLARIRSLLVKRRQTNVVIGPGEVRSFEILAHDEPMDLAFIGYRASFREGTQAVRPLSVRGGDAARLSWGSFVYVLGYPAGYPMVTRGIVSVAPERGRGGFVVDGLWNDGMSGGLILGVRGQGGDLEWLGMVRAAAAEVEPRLVAPERAIDGHDYDLPYQGPIFLEETLRIRYGIMLPVSITEIRRFVDRHRPEVRRAGYEVNRF